MKYLASLLLMFSFLVSCAGHPLKAFTSDVPEGLTEKQVAKAIKLAILARRWTVGSTKTKNTIVADLYTRGHEISLNIVYSKSSYSLNYGSSQKMKYNEAAQTIHKKYNAWVGRLKAEINRELTYIANGQ
jgi:hypothetical protein